MDLAHGRSESNGHGRLARRALLAGAAGLSAGALVGRARSLAHAAVSAAPAGHVPHGVELRGMYLTSRNRTAEGRFGMMFKKLPPYAPSDDLLRGLSESMVEDQTVPDDSLLNTNPRLFAGYTFIGQFIDHDITFDNTPLAQQEADPYATTNFRTPRYDLDSVYGRGPALEPQFYDPADPDKLLVTPNVHGVPDVPRGGDGRAIIPEGRNDENLILVQLHQAVARFHNRLVDHARAQGIRREWVFETARRLTRWHYQWAVTHDFLPRFVGDALVGPNGTVYREVAGRPPVLTLTYYRPTNKDGRPFMPVEFAVAAYRFGHSLIRPFYVINQSTSDRGGVPVFGADGGFNLNGGRPVPPDLVVEWKHILPVDPAFPARRPRRIDTRLSLPLTTLPAPVVPPPDPTVHLAVRNSLRGKAVGLPSGQQVARLMRAPVLTNAALGLSNDPGWGGEAPLWYYVLKEAELPPTNAERLGAVGGRIVAEVLVGLLQRDPTSYLYLDPAWKPAPPIAPATGQFGFVDLLRFAGAA
ncbi:peroxidase family protein [Nocardioides xinjiangensis]|uniref:peroxidase family protein n=1 Tax=Nocardioides xinjiangensis TaxID=2817376 RepID=UPI001B301E26|nr:heme peroxidase family protein [Nocardioides sp. SYSU D00514]